MVGVEALMRWRHPTKGLIFPDDFIAVAERIGLIKELGVWLLKTACAQSVAWRNMGLPRIQMAVNISPTHFRDPALSATIIEVLGETGWEAGDLELEVTESVVQTTGENIDMFNQLRSIGLRIAIDDFGTGYSSLNYLRELPVHAVKIDYSFVSEIEQSEKGAALVAAIVGMAQGLGIDIVAEGVENTSQSDYLEELGCHIMQGFLFSRPVAVNDFLGRVITQKENYSTLSNA